MKKNKEKQVGKISLHLSEINNAYSTFSDLKNDVVVLDDAFINYIEESAKENVKKDEIELHLNVDEKVDEKSKEKFSEVFKKHYRHEQEENAKTIKRLNIISFSLLGIGAIIIVLLHFLFSLNVPYIVTTILEICAWVFVWEFVDTFFFKKFGYKIKKMFYNKLEQASIIIF